ncbi:MULTISPECIES: alpha/beta hydrolase family protein [unclassified Shewanella]|uniref:alpha/beta hydrolase family protein n=1 Tax=Shewanella TaxID=22 RepID=UPI0021DAA659|nr:MULTISPECIES: S9 family peptidase [unclassified Shewanella]MCU8022283.1 S9 family peptidase [Shewanella sp. SM78]MCU8044743.1 S9 family peptidase [Shewanella sp. SM68]MCU8049029.1 S9 family peptidase [Shewanella sp. SM65]MCU8079574.1 S9 family peptidase [Shewanella sp. SM103]
MKLFRLAALATLCLPILPISTFAANSSNANALSQAQLFSKGDEYSDVKISPTGKYLSAITSVEGKNVLLVLDTQTKKLLNAIRFPDNAQVGDYEWANSERLVLAKEYLKGWQDTPIYYGELMAVNADGSRKAYLFGFESGEQQTGSNIKKNTPMRASAFILDPLPDDERYMLVNAIPWNDRINLDFELSQDVYRVDLFNGTRKRITGSPIGRARFMTDHDGEVRFVAGEDNKNITKVFYRKDGNWVNTDKLNLGLADFKPLSFADDKNTIYAAGRSQGETLGVYKINLETGDKTEIIQDENVDPSNFWINGTNKQLYAVEFENGYPSYAFVDNEDSHAKLLKDLLGALPGHQVRIVSETRDAAKLVVLAFNDRNPGDYYIFDTKTLKLEYLAAAKKWLNPEQMADVKPISFTSRDGKQLHGYLTLPFGKEAKNLPLVVNPHGGPHGIRDWWGFDPQNQYLASQGIAVLQVNFRGSGGYGDQFERAGYQKWGSDIQHDIIDATQYVIDQGFADKERICIVGGSFGGYSALQSAVLAPDMFKCAIGVAGVYDLELMFNEGDVANSRSGTSYLKDVLGQDKAVLKAMSPSENVDKLKANILLVHGGEDERAPIEQLESLEKGLKAHNYPYQKLVMDNEGHGFYNDEHRAKYYEQMLSFLKTNLKL